MFSYKNNKIIKRWNFNCSINLENMMMQIVFPNIPIMPTINSRIPSIINLTLALKSSSSIFGWMIDSFETMQLFEKFMLILGRFQRKNISSNICFWFCLFGYKCIFTIFHVKWILQYSLFMSIFNLFSESKC